MERRYTPHDRMWPPRGVVLGGVLLLVVVVGCRILGEKDSAPEAGLAAMARWPRDAETENRIIEFLISKPVTPANFGRGISLGLFSRDPDYDYGPLIDEIAAHDADRIALFLNLYQRDGASVEMASAAPQSVRDAILERTILQARERGLRVMVFPVVLLSHPRGREWRGSMNPADPSAWFENYGTQMAGLAGVSARAGAEDFCVGSELSSMEKHEDHWRGLIRRVRGVFHGRVFYSANWDHYRSVPFRDALDVFGLSVYYELTDKNDPGMDELVRAWELERDAIVNWKRTHAPSQPLVFTEIGYANQDGTNMFPWDYTQTRPPDPREQAMCIEAFVRVWHAEPELSGVYFYNWFGQATDEDRGYSPRGKPAAAVIAAWFGHLKE